MREALAKHRLTAEFAHDRWPPLEEDWVDASAPAAGNRRAACQESAPIQRHPHFGYRVTHARHAKPVHLGRDNLSAISSTP